MTHLTISSLMFSDKQTRSSSLLRRSVGVLIWSENKIRQAPLGWIMSWILYLRYPINGIIGSIVLLQAGETGKWEVTLYKLVNCLGFWASLVSWGRLWAKDFFVSLQKQSFERSENMTVHGWVVDSKPEGKVWEGKCWVWSYLKALSMSYAGQRAAATDTGVRPAWEPR